MSNQPLPPHKRKLEGVQYLFNRADDFEFTYYLECTETGDYLAKTRRSEFLLKYSHRTHKSVAFVGFTTLESALEHASKQTKRKRQHLTPRIIGDFFTQFISGGQ